MPNYFIDEIPQPQEVDIRYIIPFEYNKEPHKANVTIKELQDGTISFWVKLNKNDSDYFEAPGYDNFTYMGKIRDVEHLMDNNTIKTMVENAIKIMETQPSNLFQGIVRNDII